MLCWLVVDLCCVAYIGSRFSVWGKVTHAVVYVARIQLMWTGKGEMDIESIKSEVLNQD